MPVHCVSLEVAVSRQWGEPRIFPACGLTRTLEDADSGGEVVDSPGGAESSGEDGGRGDKIVGEGVVEVALWLLRARVSGADDEDVTGSEGGAEGIPEARKRPGHRQTPSRSCAKPGNQQLSRSRWLGPVSWVGAVDYNGSRHGSEASGARESSVSRPLQELGTPCRRLTGPKTPRRSPPGARSACGSMW